MAADRGAALSEPAENVSCSLEGMSCAADVAQAGRAKDPGATSDVPTRPTRAAARSQALCPTAVPTLAGILRQLLHVLAPHSWHGPACGNGAKSLRVSGPWWDGWAAGWPQHSNRGRQRHAHACPGGGKHGNVELTGLPSLGTAACMALRLAVGSCEGLGLQGEGARDARSAMFMP